MTWQLLTNYDKLKNCERVKEEVDEIVLWKPNKPSSAGLVKMQQTSIIFYTLHYCIVSFLLSKCDFTHSIVLIREISEETKLFQILRSVNIIHQLIKQHTAVPRVNSDRGCWLAEAGCKSLIKMEGDELWVVDVLGFKLEKVDALIIPFRRMRKHSIPAFIEQTWKMLQEGQNWSTIGWGRDECSFHILDETRFAETLLPKYFKHSNFSSFIRQLNMYNFHKRKTPEGHTEFHHKLFRKNQRQLLIGIRRKPSEAQMLEADELIRRLAPECVNQNASALEACEPAKQEIEFKSAEADEETLHREYDCHPVLSIVGWMMNGYQLGLWGAQRKIKTNIILKTPPALDLENAAY